jgi:hypothetical protein
MSSPDDPRFAALGPSEAAARIADQRRQPAPGSRRDREQPHARKIVLEGWG